MRTRSLLLTPALCLLAACPDATGPESSVVVDFRVTPSAVRAGETLEARLAIHNRKSVPLELMSGCATVAMLSTTRGGQNVLLQGGNLGCLTVVRAFTIPPRDSLVQTFEIVALENEGSPTWRYTLTPQPGRYRLNLHMQVPLPDQVAEFEILP